MRPLFCRPESKRRKERRYKVVKVRPELLLNLLLSPRLIRDGIGEAYTVKLDGQPVPDDTEVDAVSCDDFGEYLMLRLWSASWPELPEFTHAPDPLIEITAYLARLTGPSLDVDETIKDKDAAPVEVEVGGWSTNRIEELVEMRKGSRVTQEDWEAAVAFAKSATETEWKKYKERRESK